ncbi:uncharacterized protein LOC113274796 [Papaver somniferum]|uniref:uncharacterized protein LOC113274796 n=1 Tax=Papaver somniferum TaxID=3469 RepID=UPI000E700A09|nr:uncharacterized protein LOC113274796 [Papaver somniferum]
MASMSTKTTLIMFCVAAAMFVAASAQDVSSPAPSPDKGAASIVPVIVDFQLHGLAALHFSKKSAFFEMHVDFLSAGGCSSSTFSDNDNNLELIRIKKYVGRHTCGAGVKLRSPKVSKKLWVNSLKETNPGSYVDFQFNDATQTFERLFIAIGSCIEGYRLCRPMIFVDATFLTGRFRGTLMAATCLNGNQGFYALAFALVPGEDVDNWDWFMRNLSNIVDDRPITFMFDRHEGLLRAIPKHFPTSHHGYCYYHLQGNLPIRKSDEKYKEVMACFKKETYALTPARYEEALIFGQITSSVAEPFNNWIRKDKRLPACALVDMIRLRVMESMNERREMSLLMDQRISLLPARRYLKNIFKLVEFGMLLSHLRMSVRFIRLVLHICTAFKLFVLKSFLRICRSHTGDRYVDYIEDYFKVTNFQQLYSIAIRPIPNYNRPEQYLLEDTIFHPIHEFHQVDFQVIVAVQDFWSTTIMYPKFF